ncbi:MAG: hypothetical protein ABH823_04875 [bacterium]
MSGTIANIVRVGYLGKNTPISFTLPQPLTRTQQAVCFTRGLAILGKEAIVGPNQGSSGHSLAFQSDAWQRHSLAVEVTGEVTDQSAFAAPLFYDGTDAPLGDGGDGKGLRDKIFSIVQMKSAEARTFSQLAESYSAVHGQTVALDRLEQVLGELADHKKIRIEGRGAERLVSYYDQVSHIQQEARYLAKALENTDSLIEGTELIELHGRHLFANFILSLSVDASVRQLCKSGTFVSETQTLWGVAGVDGNVVYWQASEDGNRAFYSENEKSPRIDQELSAFTQVVTAWLARLNTQNARPIKERWREECAKRPDFNFCALVSAHSVLRPYRKFRIATMVNPSANFTQMEQRRIVDALNFMGRDREDIHLHTVTVDETAVAFDEDGLAVAFGSVHGLPYTYDDESGVRRESTATELPGTWIRPESRGTGLLRRLYYELLVKRWRRQKSEKLFAPVQYVGRTRQVDGFMAVLDHFSDVSWTNLSPAERGAQLAVAARQDCEVDEQGVVKDAYSQTLPRTDLRKKIPWWRFFKRRKLNQFKALIDRIGPNDAVILVFRLTVWDILSAFFKTSINSLIKKRPSSW